MTNGLLPDDTSPEDDILCDWCDGLGRIKPTGERCQACNQTGYRTRAEHDAEIAERKASDPPSRQDFCSICRHDHGREIVHVCE